MMSALENLFPVVGSAMSWLEIARVTALLVALFGLSLMLRRSASSLRHSLWAGGFVALALLPLLSFQAPVKVEIVPTFGGSLTTPATPRATDVAGSPGGEETPPRTTDSRHATATELRLPASADPTPVTSPHGRGDALEIASTVHRPASATSGSRFLSPGGVAVAVFALWAVVAAFFLLRLVIGVVTLSWFSRRATPYAAEEHLAALRSDLGIRRRVRVLLTSRLRTPVTWGVFRPVVLLPASASGWSREQMEATLLHEMAHVRRLDAAWHALSGVLCAFYWFHPLVWMAAHRLELEAEKDCDAVATERVPKRRYAAHLVDIARSCRTNPLSAALVPMARPSQLRQRIETVLHGKGFAAPARRTYGLVVLGVGVIATSLAVVTTVPGEVRAAHPVSVAAPTAMPTVTTMPTIPVVPLVADGIRASSPVSGSSAAAPGKTGDRTFAISGEIETRPWMKRDWGSDRGARRQARSMFEDKVSSFVMTDNGYTMAKWETDGALVRAELAGDIRLTADDRRVESLSGGGFLVVEESRGSVSRRYELHQGEQAGSIYESAGAQRLGSVDDWLARMVLLLARHVGIDADGRVHRILDKRGPSGVLKEIEQLTSDSTRRRYFLILFDSDRLGSNAARESVAAIGRLIKSDGDKARLLIDLSHRFMDDPELTRQFFVTSETIESDGDRTRVILAVLRRDPLPRPAALAALRAIGGISSDGDQARALILAADHLAIEGSVADAYFEALQSVASDGDHARVLLHVIGHGDDVLPLETRRWILVSVGGIGSDGDSARVLIHFLQRHGIADSIRDDFFAAARGIESSGDLSRVLLRASTGEDLTDATRLALLDAAIRVRADGDRARVLIHASHLYQESETLRQAYRKTARSISSDGDYRRVMRALGEG